MRWPFAKVRREYQSPDRRYYVEYTGLGRLYVVRKQARPVDHVVAKATGLTAAIKACDDAFIRGL